MNGVRIEALGEDALLLRLSGSADAACNRNIHALAAAITTAAPEWLSEVVPAYASLAVLLRAEHDGPARMQDAVTWLQQLIDTMPALQGPHDFTTAAALEIPVLYGGEHGPDLDAVAAHAGITPGEVIARHSAADYSVAMLGFAPGFPYLLGLDSVLAMPRLATPRTRVAAGSVGIGGAQAGIYPQAGPGGWRIIGRTPLHLFDARRDPPSLLHPGQRLRFVPVDALHFQQLLAGHAP